MVYFPVRKCYHVAKICLLLLLVVSLLALFEHYRGGKRATKAELLDPIESEYERQILEDEARIIPGLGEGGVAAHLLGEDKRLGEESEKKLAINVHLSERIAYNRTLKDHRNPACKRVVYDAELPSASVVIIFHNEPYSVVVRTIWSVVNSARRDQPWYQHANFVDRDTGRTMTLGYPGQDPNSPLVYLKEIILVDDNSTLPELKGKLSHYIRTRLPPDLIRILRLPDRQGLIKARMRGARAARGDVLIFLDAHCEANTDWLRPLLQRIRHKRDAVLTPLIDVIDQTTFHLDAAEYFQVGGFTFMGHFTWIDVPEREKKRRGSDISPTWSPTMAGGLFAINRAYYWELGAYDEQMAGWGGENLEISFRIWQCGGTLETVPCSRVGHVFRSFHPYGLPAHSDTHGINTARMAEVWMDEYAELFYLHRPDLRKNPKIGDVTHRRVLREKLHCKSFQWYLDNVYPDKFVPVAHVHGYGRFSNPGSGLCLDTLQREAGSPLGVYPCHARLHATQYLALSLAGQLRTEEDCAELQYAREEDVNEVGRRVLMVNCHGKQRGQKWKYLPSGQLQHEESQLCLAAGREAGDDARARPCGPAPDQRWRIDYSRDNDFRAEGEDEPSEQEQRLRKLRGQRRISRSLLSTDETDTDENDIVHTSHPTPRRHSHRVRKRPRKHRRTKNKFIVKLLRTVMNGTEQHLELDIHCKHKKLYPNNSFVRDLVSILNERNIKVINNGRVFERNKVMELSRGHSRLQHTQGETEWPPKKRKRGRSELRTSSAATAAPPADKRIIIEDFVELTTATAPVTKRLIKKRKRKRLQTAAPSPSPRRPPHARHELVAVFGNNRNDHTHSGVSSDVESMKAEPRSWSTEDVPMASGSDRESERDAASMRRGGGRGGGRQHAARGESRFPRNNSRAPYTRRSERGHAREHARPRVRTDSEGNENESDDGDTRTHSLAEHAGEHARPPPVKVVMRSNLTFNLDDKFFALRRQAPEDVADIIGELAIPSNVSRGAPLVQTRLEPRDDTIQDRGNTHQGRGNSHQGRGNSHQERGNSHLEKGNSHLERGNSHQERGNSHQEWGNSHKEKGNSHLERGNSHQERGNLHQEQDNSFQEQDKTKDERNDAVSNGDGVLQSSDETYSASDDSESD